MTTLTVILIIILGSIVLSTMIALTIFFFVDKSCLPYKRKMDNMLSTIKSYQREHNDYDIEVYYKGKNFNVYVEYNRVNYYYQQYEVYVNGNHVKTFHILHHLFSKSRLDEHQGNMREYEENEIIKAAYKIVKNNS